MDTYCSEAEGRGAPARESTTSVFSISGRENHGFEGDSDDLKQPSPAGRDDFNIGETDRETASRSPSGAGEGPQHPSGDKWQDSTTSKRAPFDDEDQPKITRQVSLPKRFDGLKKKKAYRLLDRLHNTYETCIQLSSVNITKNVPMNERKS